MPRCAVRGSTVSTRWMCSRNSAMNVRRRGPAARSVGIRFRSAPLGEGYIEPKVSSTVASSSKDSRTSSRVRSS